MKHIGTIELNTKRLLLRKFKIEDSFFMFKNWASNENVTKYLTWEPHKDIDTTKSILESWINSYDNLNYYQWCIVLKDIDEPIGSIGVVLLDEENELVQIGYCIGERWWGKGITTEALQKIIEFLFSSVKIKKIETKHIIENIASGKVMKKSGMIFQGNLKKENDNEQLSYYLIENV